MESYHSMRAENYSQDKSNPQYLHVCIKVLHLSGKKIYKMFTTSQRKQIYIIHQILSTVRKLILKYEPTGQRFSVESIIA